MTAPVVTTAICRHCGRKIEKVSGRFGVFWYDVVSGDEGGTYDHCESSPLFTHKPGGR